jgi:hypothetical protein
MCSQEDLLLEKQLLLRFRATFIRSSKEDGSTSCNSEETDPPKSSSTDEIVKIARFSISEEISGSKMEKKWKPYENITTHFCFFINGFLSSC